MKVAEAVELFRRVEAIKTSGSRVKLRFPERERAALQTAIDVLQSGKAELLVLLADPVNEQRTIETTSTGNDQDSPEAEAARLRAGGLKGTAVEIHAEAAGGRVWIVADEEDARLAQERLGVSRGEPGLAKKSRLWHELKIRR